MGFGLPRIPGPTSRSCNCSPIFHDSRRVNEGTDEGTARRGAELATQLRGDWFDLPDEDFDLLCFACARHTDGLMDGDITVRTCWDADRLDLGRVGICPEPKRLCTAAAKSPDILKWADGRGAFHGGPRDHHEGLGNRYRGLGKGMSGNILYVADRASDSFQRERMLVDVVCAGDSLTGWNNEGPIQYWPYPTYPQFLAELAHPLRIANGGIAGEISENGIGQVRDYLDLFPNARCFIIAYGTNDLGCGRIRSGPAAASSRTWTEWCGRLPNEARRRCSSTSLMSTRRCSRCLIATDSHQKRDYHNARLKEYCDQHGIPLADICSHLRGEHFADELHPNGAGARIIAEEVFKVLGAVYKVVT